MKVYELKTRLENIMKNSHISEDYEIVIPNNKNGGMGGTPNTRITGIRTGFDWDRGLVFLYPEHDMINKPSNDL